jgi:hypothetical protein
VAGPVHEYVAPATVLALRFIAEPVQTGLLLLAVGAAGVGITVTTTEAGKYGHPSEFTNTVYVIVTVGEAMGLGELALLSPVAGDHV